MKITLIANNIFIFLALTSCSDSTSTANSLFVESNQLVEQADQTSDIKTRAELLAKANDNIKTIVTNHSDTSLAVQLSTGQSIGKISVEKVAKLKNEADGNVQRMECINLPTIECLVSMISKIAQDTQFEIDELWKKPPDLTKIGEKHKTMESINDDIYFIAQSQAEAGDTKGAFKTIKEIKNNEKRILANLKTIKMQVKIEGLVTAKKNLENILGEVHAVTDDALNNILIEKISTFAAVGEIQYALSMAYELSGYDREQALREIALMQADLGDFHDALKTAESNSHTLFLIASQQAKIDIDAAIKTAKSISKIGFRDLAFRFIAEEASKQRGLSTALKIANNISKASVYNETITSIAEGRVSVGDFTGATNTIHNIKPQPGYNYKPIHSDKILSSIAIKQTTNNMLNEAQETTSKINNNDEREETKLQINKQTGNLLVTLKTIEEIKDQNKKDIVTYQTTKNKINIKKQNESLDKLYKTALLIHNDPYKVASLFNISRIHLNSNNISSAKTINHIAFVCFESINNIEHRATAISLIAHTIINEKTK